MREKGFTPILLLLIVFVGLCSGLYLVSQKTNILSPAFTSKEIMDLFSSQPIATDSSQEFTYQLPTPTPAKNNSFLSAFQMLLQRNTNRSSGIPSTAQTKIIPTLKPTSIATSDNINSSTSNPTPNPDQSESYSTSVSQKPICSVLVAPSNTGTAPYQASVCVGNNSNPYQALQQELVDYTGGGSWDYQGPSYGCHSFTFQNPGTYTPKAKIISISGQESDVCQTTAVILAANPTPTPIPTPGQKIAANSCSSVTVEGDVTYLATYTDQDGYPYSIYSIKSGGMAKLTAQTDPPRAYVNWKIVNTSMYLPYGGVLIFDPIDYTVVTFVAPNNPARTDQGTYVRGDYSEYPDPWKHCPSVDFAVKPG